MPKIVQASIRFTSGVPALKMTGQVVKASQQQKIEGILARHEEQVRQEDLWFAD